MKKKQRYSDEVKERAVRLVKDSLADHKSEWSAICSIAMKVGCSSETLRNWIRKSNGVETKTQTVEADAEHIKLLEREIFELQRANEILRKASAFFAHSRNGDVHRPSPCRIWGRADSERVNAFETNLNEV